ncbi:hypothetical protein QZH41_007689 [Actinostola sp. cb2023]|nr:hypothetical protein QZH41_007689 [Actinostola sp. cb2023]
MAKANAYFLLKTKEEGRITQKCLDKIVSTTSEIVKNSVNVVKAQMVSALENSGLDYKDIQGLEDVFSEESPAMNPFQGISNERSQTQYYKDNFGLVEPVGIVLGQKHVKRRRKTTLKDVRENDMVYYIPLLECLQQLLNNDSILEEFHEQHFTLRTIGGYITQCQNIAGNDYYKKVYGINRYSSLNNSRFYHIIGSLPADAMHDILEGIYQYEVKELLKELINNQNLFTVDELTKRMQNFDYGYHDDSNKPSPITEAKLTSSDHNLKQKDLGQ